MPGLAPLSLGLGAQADLSAVSGCVASEITVELDTAVSFAGITTRIGLSLHSVFRVSRTLPDLLGRPILHAVSGLGLGLQSLHLQSDFSESLARYYPCGASPNSRDCYRGAR